MYPEQRPCLRQAPFQLAPKPEGAGALVCVGYVMAVLVPIVGFIIVAATRPAPAVKRHGRTSSWCRWSSGSPRSP